MVPREHILRCSGRGLGDAKAAGLQAEEQYSHLLHTGIGVASGQTFASRRLPAHRTERLARFSETLAGILLGTNRGACLSPRPSYVSVCPRSVHENNSGGEPATRAGLLCEYRFRRTRISGLWSGGSISPGCGLDGKANGWRDSSGSKRGRRSSEVICQVRPVFVASRRRSSFLSF